jgi:hypothetical protein
MTCVVFVSHRTDQQKWYQVSSKNDLPLRKSSHFDSSKACVSSKRKRLDQTQLCSWADAATGRHLHIYICRPQFCRYGNSEIEGFGCIAADFQSLLWNVEGSTPSKSQKATSVHFRRTSQSLALLRTPCPFQFAFVWGKKQHWYHPHSTDKEDSKHELSNSIFIIFKKGETVLCYINFLQVSPYAKEGYSRLSYVSPHLISKLEQLTMDTCTTGLFYVRILYMKVGGGWRFTVVSNNG